MSEKNLNNQNETKSAAKKNVFSRFFGTLWRWTRRTVMGPSKELAEMDVLAVENLETPSKMAIKTFFRRKLAEHHQIKTRAAAHGAKVDDFILLFRIAQEGSPQMFHGMDGGHIHHRFFIGPGQPQIKGGYGLFVAPIPAGYIQPGK